MAFTKLILLKALQQPINVVYPPPASTGTITLEQSKSCLNWMNYLMIYFLSILQQSVNSFIAGSENVAAAGADPNTIEQNTIR